jgi:acetyl esterase
MNSQVQQLIEALRAAIPPGAPRLWQLPAAQGRMFADAFMVLRNEGGPEMAERRDLTIPGRRGAIGARLYVPRTATALSPGLLYLHGGGFVIGSPDTHDRLTRELAHDIGARVLSLHYALAPEHPYPAGLHDCVDASRWLAANAATLGIDAKRLVIGGDSAGANLSAATILRLRAEAAAPAFRAALLIYGRFTGDDTDSMRAWGERDLILSRPMMEWFERQYVGDAPDRNDPYYAPLAGDLHGFPPSILTVGTLDPLLDDSRLFAAALEKAGVPAELHVYEDGPHAFAQFAMLDMCGDAIAKMSAFARKRLEP